jgi:abequosyltransferase
MLIDTIELTICVPIYNCGEYISQMLDSVCGQFSSTCDSIEVLVMDGASSDNTPAIVNEYAARCPQVRYVRLQRRGGIDADLAECVRLARGKYCWLFSGDDVMRDGALRRALGWLPQEHDVYLNQHSFCDLHMNILGEFPVFSTNSIRIAELSDPQQRVSYLRAGLNTQALFSFISGIIVRRDKWLSVDDPREFMGSCYGHVARLLTLAQRQLSVCYVGDLWVDKRGDNDSFLSRGLVYRLGITVDGYQRIANHFFGSASPEAAQIRRMVGNELPLPLWLSAKCRTYAEPEIESRTELDRLVRACYSGVDVKSYLIRAAYILTPVHAFRMLRWIYRLMNSEDQIDLARK